MGAMSDLSRGFAQTISDTGIAQYRADGSAYLSSETAITFNDLAPSPDRCLCLTAVPMTDAEVIPLGLAMVQVKSRGLPGQVLDCNDLADAVFDLFHGATNLTFGSTHAVQIFRRVSVPPTQDAARRWVRIDHYYVDLDYPATTNRPAGGWD